MSTFIEGGARSSVDLNVSF